jgi:hypothetical protein
MVRLEGYRDKAISGQEVLKSGGIAPHILNVSTRYRLSGQLHTPAVLSLVKESSLLIGYEAK